MTRLTVETISPETHSQTLWGCVQGAKWEEEREMRGVSVSVILCNWTGISPIKVPWHGGDARSQTKNSRWVSHLLGMFRHGVDSWTLSLTDRRPLNSISPYLSTQHVALTPIFRWIGSQRWGPAFKGQAEYRPGTRDVGGRAGAATVTGIKRGGSSRFLPVGA